MSDESVVNEAGIGAGEEGGSQTPPENVAPNPSKLKLSTGEELDEAEVLTGLNHVREANKRFQDAAAERRAAAEERNRIAQEKAEVEAKIQKLKDDPWGLMQELGLDPRTMSEEYLLKALEAELMTPEQKKIAELEKKAKAFEDLEKERKEAEKKAEEDAKRVKEEEIFNQYKTEAAKSYEEKMISALSSTILPKSATTIRRVADKIFQSALAGEEIPVEHAVKLEEMEYLNNLVELAETLEGDQIEKVFGKKLIEKIRKHDVGKLKNPIPTPKLPEVSKESKAKHKDNPYVDPYDYVRNLKKQHGVI